MTVIRKETSLGNLYLVDTNQFNLNKITSVFCYSDGDKALLFDIGTSHNVDHVLNSLDSRGIPPEKIIGIILSHYHFDHGGGSSELWKKMSSINSNFRIYTNSFTKELLQNSEGHIKGATTTFGPFVGTMDFIPDEAFEIVELDSFIPVEFNDGARVKLVYTPGHTSDHCSPAVYLDEKVSFLFAAEAAGTFYTYDSTHSTPTSMPPNFKYDVYMKSLEKILAIKPEAIGFCHFGIISGADEVQSYLIKHGEFMKKFREAIIKAFNENPSTSHVLESTAYLWENRFGEELLSIKGSEYFFKNLRLALTYGVMVDLGFRKPRYEEPSNFGK
ncbi:MAG: MBL fold metallo-hydrolase [Spirochaetota bacterium]